MSASAQTMSSGSAAASAVSSGAVIGVSILNLSSIAAIWSLVNQFQLFLLLLLTKTPFPDDVKGMILGNNLMSFDLSAFPVMDIPQVNWTLSFINFEQENTYLEAIGIESKGGIVNNASFVITILLFIILYPIVMLLKC